MDMKEVREKIDSNGVESLSVAELIRLIARGKTGEPFRIAESFATDGGIKAELGRCKSAGEIGIKFGLTKLQAVSVLAAMELGKRVTLLPTQKPYRVASPSDAASYFMKKLRFENHERFLVMLLNTKSHVIRVLQIAEGSLSSAVVHPREVFAPAIIHHAASIIVAHNHPTGDPHPSSEDKQLTKTLKNTGEIFGVPLQDHIVIGDGWYYSFREHGDM